MARRGAFQSLAASRPAAFAPEKVAKKASIDAMRLFREADPAMSDAVYLFEMIRLFG